MRQFVEVILARSVSSGVFLLAGAVGIAGLGSGCVDPTPPPARVAAPPLVSSASSNEVEIKPLPTQSNNPNFPVPPFNDEPIVTQALPGQSEFVNAYNQVGRPRILVFVNRNLDGQMMPVNNPQPITTVEQTAHATGAVNIDSQSHGDTYSYWYDSHRQADSHFQTTGPADFKQSTTVYLHPGEYDEASAKQLDYEAIENILTDWLSADGKVTMVSPSMAQGKLSDEQIKDLQSSRPQLLGEIARQLNADVLIQAQAHPTLQTQSGTEFRLIVEAINVRGGESIARGVVDIPPPLDKTKINKYTRFLAEKLMNGMANTWEAAPATPPPAASPAASPTTEPSR